MHAYTVCFAPAPAGWMPHSLQVAGGVDFQLGAVSGDGRTAFGRYRAAGETGVGAVDLVTGSLTRIAALPAGAAGIGAMAAAQPWVAWEQANSTADLGDWSLRAWNQQTSEVLDLATSRLPDGGEAFGQAPLPAVARGLVAWAQPGPRQGGYPEAAVELYDLARRRATVLDTGRVSSPVFAGPSVVWASIEAGGTYALHAVDAATLRPAALPGRVRGPASVLYLAGSGRYLAWSGGQQDLHVWRIGTGEYADYATDLRHPLQFLTLAGDFVVWYAGYPSSVLDLRTGRAFDVHGALAGSDALIAESEPSRPPASKNEIVPARLSYVPLAAAPPLGAC